ncbi:MAG TPA: hypothetical protein VJ276_23215 [Thermoanaerobaculia bacterium]|nr:hypothetical protein [Thermoanaerobaculia bacterium]
MKRISLALSLAALLLAGCASSKSDSGLGKAKVKLAEPELVLQQVSTVPSAARHVEGGIPLKYRLRVANRAGEPITLKRIDIVSLGSGAYRLPSTSRPFQTVIQPDHYDVVEFWAPGVIEDVTILGANGPVTLRLTAHFDSPVGQFDHVVVQQVHADLGDTSVPQ